MELRVKRVYDPVSANDGLRILVDRLWPRGLSKEKAAIDHWLKNTAPSTELRKWFHAHLEDWDTFRERYHAELDDNPEIVAEVRELVNTDDVCTLLFSTREQERNHALLLRDYLSRRS
ncbi:MAG: DUF488 family protein [Acidobacteriota bacterium]